MQAMGGRIHPSHGGRDPCELWEGGFMWAVGGTGIHVSHGRGCRSIRAMGGGIHASHGRRFMQAMGEVVLKAYCFLFFFPFLINFSLLHFKMYNLIISHTCVMYFDRIHTYPFPSYLALLTPLDPSFSEQSLLHPCHFISLWPTESD